MKNQIYKDKNKRKLCFETETKLTVLRSIYKSNNIPKSLRWNTGLLFEKFVQNYPSANVNRCIVTGRKKKIAKLFKFSRLRFLNFARTGFISGLTKSTW